MSESHSFFLALSTALKGSVLFESFYFICSVFSFVDAQPLKPLQTGPWIIKSRIVNRKTEIVTMNFL